MTVERLVQQLGIERTDVFVTAEGQENTTGIEEAGSDIDSPASDPKPRGDAELNGRIVVSVDVEDERRADEIRSAFTEFEASEVAEE